MDFWAICFLGWLSGALMAILRYIERWILKGGASSKQRNGQSDVQSKQQTEQGASNRQIRLSFGCLSYAEVGRGRMQLLGGCGL